MSGRFATLRQIPGGVWVLGFVSLLMDTSSELIHSLLPMFLVTTLGVSVFAVGLIEGVAEATALIVKVFSGALSDYVGRRKGLTVLGYGLGALSKPAFALAAGLPAVMAARFADRVGKGIRDAPRDALLADITPPSIRGAAYGLRQSLDTLGALLGPLLAVALMLLWANDFRAVFWFASVPAAACVALLWVGLKEPRRVEGGTRTNPIRRAALAKLPAAYWSTVLLGGLFALARFSEAFLVLRAQDRGVPMALVPLVMVAMNAVYAASAYPFGKLADRVDPRRLLAGSLAVLVAADVVLATAGHWAAVLAGVALWGLHMGMSQGLLATMVAQVSPAALRGTAFGLFNLISGAALLVASALAGWLWDGLGAAATFAGGAVLAGLTLVALLLLGQRTPADH